MSSVRPRTTKWSTFRAPPSPSRRPAAMELLPSAGEHADATTTPPDSHRSRALGATSPLPTKTTRDGHRRPPTAVHSQRHRLAKPTTAKPSLPRSKPFITTATASTFQIRRGRKLTLITVAIRGESSSPVINKFNSIPFRSMGHHSSGTERLDRMIQEVHHVDPIKSTANNPSPARAPLAFACPSSPPHVAMPARRHRLARPLPAARHSACRQGRRGRVAPTANHDDADISCRHSYSARTATVLDQNRL
ncbi:hypothetical protein ACLOJK_009172 [Asimina triloba]